jgi:hypothetical protein
VGAVRLVGDLTVVGAVPPVETASTVTVPCGVVRDPGVLMRRLSLRPSPDGLVPTVCRDEDARVLARVAGVPALDPQALSLRGEEAHGIVGREGDRQARADLYSFHPGFRIVSD